MSATTHTTQSALSNLSSGYVDRTAANKEKSNELGRDEFMTLLVAQLQNQDPLNPADSTDFSSQLAQYSQLEQLMNMNQSMTALSNALTGNSKSDGVDYIGKEVTGNIDSIDVSSGEVTKGFYNLKSAADVIVDIFDADGKQVKRLYEGQKSSGGQILSWDGTDNALTDVADGRYTYVVRADYGSGYEEITTSVTGTVDGVTYNNDIPYLIVQGVLVAVEDVTSVSDINGQTDKPSWIIWARGLNPMPPSSMWRMVRLPVVNWALNLIPWNRSP